MRAAKFKIRCPICGKLFESYEDYASHIFSEHPDSLRARFKAEIIRE
ncbi:MAG: hypothetical protein J7L83_03240 [Thaumarchaeota archaeon]|nr:hypothetical protein [Nitrososphaerota archaeon]